jgi:hypothetical protein
LKFRSFVTSVASDTYKKFLPILILFLNLPGASAQVKSGTIIVIGYSKQKVVVAADSREELKPGVYHDDACKITALNDKIIFLASGRTSDVTGGIRGWDSIREAKTALADVLHEPTADGAGFIPRLAVRWASLIGLNIAQHLRPEEELSLNDGQIYVDGTFFGLNREREIEGAYERLRYTRALHSIQAHPPDVVSLPDQMMYSAVGGERDIALEFKEGKTERAQREAKSTVIKARNWSPADSDALMAKRLVELTIQYTLHPDHVGGDIDVAELSPKSGVRWIYRKPNCKELHSSLP